LKFGSEGLKECVLQTEATAKYYLLLTRFLGEITNVLLLKDEAVYKS